VPQQRGIARVSRRRTTVTKTYNRTLALAAGAVATLGMLPMASLANAAPLVGEAVAFPETGTYIADVPGADGTMTMVIAVAGDDVVVFATNGVDDEAYFSGTEQDGSFDLTSTNNDRLTAAFDGTAVNGTLTTNDVAQSFAAPAVSVPAGMYTAELGDTRASWVVRTDQSIVGTQGMMSRTDNELSIDRQLQPAPSMTYGTWNVDMNGTPMTAVPVTGNTTL
jgi:hypothetical protein